MNVHFYSKASDFEIDFYAEAIVEDNYIKFKDESLENTNIYLKIDDEALTFVRKGDVSMNVIYKKGCKTKGSYQNINGLEFDFEVDTKYLYIEDNKVELAYYLYIDEELNNMCKICVSWN